MTKKQTGRKHAKQGHLEFRKLLFEEVQRLWHAQKSAGIPIQTIANRIGRKVAWVERHLNKSDDWTLKVAGELIRGLDGKPSLLLNAK